jgi:hypothetical protein
LFSWWSSPFISIILTLEKGEYVYLSTYSPSS